MQNIPTAALVYGFVNSTAGTHGSRTIILAELRALLAARPASSTIEAYRVAVVDDNVLLKRTVTTRRESFRRLRELYALTPDTLLFYALRELWDADIEAQPLLALLCACARDALLRGTVELILTALPHASVTPEQLSAAVDDSFPSRYSSTTLANVGRHAASSWQQSGHLEGRLRKTRARAPSHPSSVAYALLLGYLCGVRGEGLFHTMWARSGPGGVPTRVDRLSAQWERHRHRFPLFPLARWMAGHRYREAYFEDPADMQLALETFAHDLAAEVGARLSAPDADEETVVAVMGRASLFGLARASALIEAVAPAIRGRLLVFFPGQYENAAYRLLGARDGWNYLAIPITAADDEQST